MRFWHAGSQRRKIKHLYRKMATQLAGAIFLLPSEFRSKHAPASLVSQEKAGLRTGFDNII